MGSIYHNTTNLSNLTTYQRRSSIRHRRWSLAYGEGGSTRVITCDVIRHNMWSCEASPRAAASCLEQSTTVILGLGLQKLYTKMILIHLIVFSNFGLYNN